jgi:hypothetical protein
VVFPSQNGLVHELKLKNDGDVRTMFYIFSQYMTKGLIELDAKLVRSVEAICSNLIRPRIILYPIRTLIVPNWRWTMRRFTHEMFKKLTF